MSDVPFADYLPYIRSRTEQLIEVAAPQLSSDVPSCPGWSMTDLIDHVTEVYWHKEIATRTGKEPENWPPAELPGDEPIEKLTLALEGLMATLAEHKGSDVCWTWNPEDQTVGFWHRRMAQEIAIHGFDGLNAVGANGGITPEIAADGVDELLQVFISGDWSDIPQAGADQTVHVSCTDTDDNWRIALTPTNVAVERVSSFGVEKPDALLAGSASDVDLVLWHRLPPSFIQVDGGDEATRFLDRLKIFQS